MAVKRVKITKEDWLKVNRLLLRNLQDMLILHCEMSKIPNRNDEEEIIREIQELTQRITRTEHDIELMEKGYQEFFEIPDDDCLDETIEMLSHLIEVTLQIAVNEEDNEIRTDAEAIIKELVATRDELIVHLQVLE